jgi:hypothetical protein
MSKGQKTGFPGISTTKLAQGKARYLVFCSIGKPEDDDMNHYSGMLWDTREGVNIDLDDLARRFADIQDPESGEVISLSLFELVEAKQYNERGQGQAGREIVIGLSWRWAAKRLWRANGENIRSMNSPTSAVRWRFFC